MSAPITGTASILTEFAPCWVVLINEATGVAIATVQANALTGVYEFGIQPAGKYALAFVDPAGGYRGKIVHTEILP